MTIRPCTAIQPDGKTCGATPILTKRIEDGNHILQIKCECGNHGGSVFYQKPEDAERTEQSTIDGWNRSQ